MEIKKYFDTLLDLPSVASKKINEKIPVNCWGSCMKDSEKSIPSWINMLIKIGTVAFVLGSLFTIIKGFQYIGDVFNAGAVEGIGFILASAFWAFIIFPVANLIKDFGDEIASSKSNMIEFVARDIPLAAIRAAGYIAALIALFCAIGITFGWITTIPLGGIDIWGEFGFIIEQTSAAISIGVYALGTFLTAISDIVGTDADMFLEPLAMLIDLDVNTNASYFGDAFDMGRLSDVVGSFVGVIMILIATFISMLLYKWIYSIAVTFARYISGPYFPHKGL